jgi:hypothetical protein
VDVAIVAVLVAMIFGLAGRRVARAHGRPGWVGFAVAALVPPAGLVAAVWALAADLPVAPASVTGPSPAVDLSDDGTAEALPADALRR